MINGFGWFDEARFRRSWLLFDEVEYVFPLSRVSHPPLGLVDRPDFKVVQPSSPKEETQRRIDRSRADSESPDFRSAVIRYASANGLRVAAQMVQLDDELSGKDTSDHVFCMSYLIEKLLDQAEANGSIPIVGQDEAVDLIGMKLAQRIQTDLSKGALVTTSQAINVFAFQAGLSYGFLEDADLLHADIRRLCEFKDKNRSLLDRHHDHLIEVSQRFDGLPRTPSFAKVLASLRREAHAKAQSLDDAAKDAWRSAGLDLMKKGAVAVTAGATTALGILATTNLSSVFQAAAPAVMVGLGTAASSAIGAVASTWHSKRSHLAYLMNASRYLLESKSSTSEGG